MTLTSASNPFDTEPVTSAGVFSFPASFAQRRLWFLDQLAPGDVSYNVAGAVQIDGALDTGALEKSVQEIVHRHESLRTRFDSTGGEPEQVIDPEATLVFERLDLRSIGEAERGLKADQLMREESQKTFDLRRGPLVRTTLMQLAEQQHRLLVTMHHIISDGWSVGILVAELAELYNAFTQGSSSPLPELPIQYADYSAWQQEQLSGESLKSLVDYWKRQLEGTPLGLEMVTDRPHRQNQSTQGAQHNLRLEVDLVRRLRQFGQKQDATLYMVLLAGFQALLFRYSGQEEILVGSPIAGRNRKETQGLIGFFVNTLVMKATLTSDTNFRQLLRNVKDTTLDAYAHQDLPFEKLVEELSPERNLGRSPFFQSMFVFQNAPMPELQLGSAILRVIDIESETAKFEITLTLFESQDLLTGSLEYSTELFDADTMARFADRFTFLLQGLVTEPDRPISSVPLVSDLEMTRLRLGWAGPLPVTSMEDADILSLFQKHASDKTKVAIVSDGQAFTYAVLDCRAERLAKRLRAVGVGPTIRVGVCTSNGVEGVVALLAVLKTGAAAVPLDFENPVTRMEYIARDAGVEWAVSDGKCNERVRQAGIQVLPLNDADDHLYVKQRVNKQSGSVGNGEALVLYQSDPSGKPKGVVVPHRALLLRPFAGSAAFLETDRIAQKVRVGIQENEIVELLRSLALGAIIVDLSGETTPRKLATLLHEQAVTVLLTRAGELERLATEFGWALKAARIIVLCEDSGMVLERLRQNLKTELLGRAYQTYGSNETWGWWALRPMDDNGKGLTEHLAAGVTLQLLDGRRQPVPEHIVGEIYIGGNHLALEHYGQAEDAFLAGRPRIKSYTRVYRSGELGWRRADGSLQLRGRHDGRGWISGVRVEAEEIEVALKGYPGLQDAAVLVGDDAVRAFLVVGDGNEIDFVAVQTWLRQQLPAVMVPQRIDHVEKVSKFLDGTVDRKALKVLADQLDKSAAASAAYASPRNDIEQKLVTIWEKTLGLDRIGIHDNFFRIGGHSLLATQVIARISDELGVAVPLRQLFDTSTIAQLAAIVASSSGLEETIVPIRRVARIAVGPQALAE